MRPFLFSARLSVNTSHAIQFNCTRIVPFMKALKPYFLFLSLLILNSAKASSNDFGMLIFEDSFERTESQELKDEPGNEWTTSSDKTAKSYKEVDLRDGHMYIYTHAEANHATSVRHAFAFKDGILGLRFMFEDENDILTLNFADMDLKTVWAGHLFKATIGTEDVKITDQKTGEMNLEIRNARQDNSITEVQKELISKKRKIFPYKLTTNHWHQVHATIQGDEHSCTIDGNLAGTFRSEGFDHKTKRPLRLLVAKNAYVDDVQIWKKR